LPIVVPLVGSAPPNQVFDYQALRVSPNVYTTLEEIDITKGCLQHFDDIRHDKSVEDVTFENVQARYRT
jgi:NAD+ synthase (glutamine-hydrolysing)